MGCDIHPYFEARFPDGTWQMIEAVDTGRSYDWFGLAAGVRRNFEESLEPRGMPDSPSWAWEYLCERNGPDFHSKSWLTPSELRDVNRHWQKRINDDREYDDDDLKSERVRDFIESLTPDHIITGIFIPDDSGRLKKIPFAGTLADFVGSNDIEDKVRLVFAFDN